MNKEIVFEPEGIRIVARLGDKTYSQAGSGFYGRPGYVFYRFDLDESLRANDEIKHIYLFFGPVGKGPGQYHHNQ